MLGLLLGSFLVVAAGLWAAQEMQPTPSVQGKAVVIVGASSGIGRSLALEYARGGAVLVLCARRQQQLAQVAAECEAHGSSVHQVVGDITQQSVQVALRDMAETRVGGSVDYLVLNAGVISVQQVVDLWDMRDGNGLRRRVDVAEAERADQALRQTMEVNVHAPVAVAGLLLPMVAAARGSIVVVSSMAGLIAAPTRSLYSASKHAVAGYFSALRMEVRSLGVHVTIAYPGTVDTQLRQSAVDRGSSPPAGSERGKMSPDTCARQILRAATLRQPTLITPLPYRLSTWLYAVVPGLIEYLAARKYGLA